MLLWLASLPAFEPVVGWPADAAGAIQLAQEDRHQFEHWALGLIQAPPISLTDASGKKGRKGAAQGIVSPN